MIILSKISEKNDFIMAIIVDNCFKIIFVVYCKNSLYENIKTRDTFSRTNSEEYLEHLLIDERRNFVRVATSESEATLRHV